MKKISVLFCAAVLFAVSLFVSCSQGVNVSESPTKLRKGSKTVDIKYQFYEPKNSPDTIFWDDFEGATVTSKNPWTSVRAELKSLKTIRDDLVSKSQAEYKDFYSSVFSGSNSQVVCLNVENNYTASIKISNLNLSQNAYLTFRYFFSAYTGSKFRVKLNDTQVLYEATSINSGACFTIETVSLSIPSGTTSISFEVEKTEGYSWTKWPNGAFIDDISLVYDKVSSVIVTPRSNQKTYVGCSGKERIRVTAYPLRADGSYVENAAVSFSSPNGNFDSNGYFTPTVAGTTTITATCNGVTGTSGQITVAASNSCEGPVTVAGVTYTGTKTVSGTLLSAQDPRYSNYNAKIAFEYPLKNTVTADGFVRIKGKLTPSTKEYSDYNKVVIYVSSGNNETVYCCDADFDLRVWLPFEGTNQIKVYQAKIQYDTYVEGDITLEGDFKQWDCMGAYTINATNTRSSSSNKMYLYPSFFCQADNYLVQNWTNEALYGLPSNASAEEKFHAIHEYICLNLYYDDTSISSNGTRKKQDAASVIKNRMAVCEGYANLTSAMARYAGIPSGVVISGELCHAWNHVWINGTELFCDTTWDDPVKDPASTYYTYNYYLLTNFDGKWNSEKGKMDHEAADKYFASRQMCASTTQDCELSELYKMGFVF